MSENRDLVSAVEARAMLSGAQTVDVGRLIDTVLALWDQVSKVDLVPLSDSYQRLKVELRMDGFVPRDNGVTIPMANSQCKVCHTNLVIEGWARMGETGPEKPFRSVIRCTTCGSAKEV